MLLLQPIDGLLHPQARVYPDHLMRSAVYRFPSKLRIARRPDGSPEFFLLRYQGDADAGGLFRLSLNFEPPSEAWRELADHRGWTVRPAPFRSGQFCLRVRSLLSDGDTQTGMWYPLTSVGEHVLRTSIQLTTTEVQLLQHQLENEPNHSSVEVPVRMSYQGLVQGIPWTVRAQLPDLRDQLEVLLTEDSVDRQQVIMAFLSLPDNDVIQWRAIEEMAEFPGRDTLLTEAAHRSLLNLFELVNPNDDPDSHRYRLRDRSQDVGSSLLWDLFTSRIEHRRYELKWSVDELAAELADADTRASLFPVVSEVTAFQRATIYVINTLPFDPKGLIEVRVDLKYPGPNGMPQSKRVTFTGPPDMATLSTVYPAITTEFKLEYKITCILSAVGGIGWPRVLEQGYRTSEDPVVEIDTTVTEIDFLRLQADLGVFDRSGRIEFDVFSIANEHDVEGIERQPDETAPSASEEVLSRIVLDRDHPDSWIPIPRKQEAAPTPIWVCCKAITPEEEEPAVYTLFDGPLLSPDFHISAADLEVLDVDRITLRVDPEFQSNAAFIAISIAPIHAPVEEEPLLMTLEPGVVREWSLQRLSVFDSLRFKYRLHYVPIDESGATQPMVVTDWLVADGKTLLVTLPTPTSATPT